MNNDSLGRDHLKRAQSRLKALDVLYAEKSWADVVREAQELIELTLKGSLRLSNVIPPRIHDVSEVLLAEKENLPAIFQQSLAKIMKISKSLRRDRELAFYGAEDLTPSDFYSEDDAKEALESARFTVDVAVRAFGDSKADGSRP